VTKSDCTDWLHHSASSPPSWCVVDVEGQYGCRRIIKVDAAHWWWLRRFSPLCKSALRANYYYNYMLVNKKKYYSKLLTSM